MRRLHFGKRGSTQSLPAAAAESRGSVEVPREPPAGVFRGDRPAWQELAPIQRAVTPIASTVAVHFEDDLRSWRDPTLSLEPLSHRRGAAEPAGEVAGIATLRTPLDARRDPVPNVRGTDLALRARPSGSNAPAAVQRRRAWPITSPIASPGLPAAAPIDGRGATAPRSPTGLAVAVREPYSPDRDAPLLTQAGAADRQPEASVAVQREPASSHTVPSPNPASTGAHRADLGRPAAVEPDAALPPTLVVQPDPPRADRSGGVRPDTPGQPLVPTAARPGPSAPAPAGPAAVAPDTLTQRPPTQPLASPTPARDLPPAAASGTAPPPPPTVVQREASSAVSATPHTAPSGGPAGTERSNPGTTPPPSVDAPTAGAAPTDAPLLGSTGGSETPAAGRPGAVEQGSASTDAPAAVPVMPLVQRRPASLVRAPLTQVSRELAVLAPRAAATPEPLAVPSARSQDEPLGTTSGPPPTEAGLPPTVTRSDAPATEPAMAAEPPAQPEPEAPLLGQPPFAIAHGAQDAAPEQIPVSPTDRVVPEPARRDAPRSRPLGLGAPIDGLPPTAQRLDPLGATPPAAPLAVQRWVELPRAAAATAGLATPSPTIGRREWPRMGPVPVEPVERRLGTPGGDVVAHREGPLVGGLPPLLHDEGSSDSAAPSVPGPTVQLLSADAPTGTHRGSPDADHSLERRGFAAWAWSEEAAGSASVPAKGAEPMGPSVQRVAETSAGQVVRPSALEPFVQLPRGAWPAAPSSPSAGVRLDRALARQGGDPAATSPMRPSVASTPTPQHQTAGRATGSGVVQRSRRAPSSEHAAPAPGAKPSTVQRRAVPPPRDSAERPVVPARPRSAAPVAVPPRGTVSDPGAGRADGALRTTAARDSASEALVVAADPAPWSTTTRDSAADALVVRADPAPWSSSTAPLAPDLPRPGTPGGSVPAPATSVQRAPVPARAGGGARVAAPPIPPSVAAAWAQRSSTQPTSPAMSAPLAAAPAPTPSSGRPIEVQRFSLGGLLGGAASLATGLGLRGLQQPKEPTEQRSEEASREEQHSERGGPQVDPAMSTDGVRQLASRMYPYISSRLKAELGTDRERAGMITGLHR